MYEGLNVYTHFIDIYESTSVLEVFHKDADVVVEELSNCIYMYGRTAHTGFPESCLERFTDELSEKGYDIIVI